jgi:membrane-associated protease RseP (regulator of RpoE activity)
VCSIRIQEDDQMTQKFQLRRAAAASLLALSLAVTGSAAVFAQDATPEVTPETSTEQAAQPTRAYFGAALDNTADGVVVVELEVDGPADLGGLEVDDVLVSIGGTEITSVRQAREVVRALPVGEPVEVVVLREGEEVTLEITPGEAPADMLPPIGRPGRGDGPGDGRPGRGDMMPFFGMGAVGMNGFLGVNYRNLDADLAAENELDVTEGALVGEVVADSPAEAAGLLAGDVILAVNGEPVDAERTLRDRLIAYEPDDVVTLDVLRDGETIQIDVTLVSPADFMPGMEMGFMPMMGDGALLDMFMQLPPEVMQQLQEQLGAQGFMFEMPVPADPVPVTPEDGASA